MTPVSLVHLLTSLRHQAESVDADAAESSVQAWQPPASSAAVDQVALPESLAKKDLGSSPARVEPWRDTTSAVAVQTRRVADADIGRAPASALGWSRPRRVIVWGVAAAFSLVVGYLVLHARNSARNAAQPAQFVRQQSNAVPAVQPVAKVESQSATPQRGLEPALSAGVAVSNNKPLAGSAASKPQGESFSDAFVKHAAAVNSNWADVKKHPKAADAASINRPASAAKSGDDPLNVLDQLEKARKAKKQAASRP